MNGKQAKRLRKLAYQQCDEEERNYIVQQFRKIFKVGDKEVEQINETIRWRPGSFMSVYRRLKREFKEGR